MDEGLVVYELIWDKPFQVEDADLKVKDAGYKQFEARGLASNAATHGA